MTDPFAGSRPLRLDRLDVPRSWRVLALAPHPDDFESTAAAHRWLRDRGNPIGLLVLSSSANGVEDAFWAEGADGKWKARSKPTNPVDELVQERTSAAVKAALKSLLDAPVASGGNKKPRKGKSNA